MHMVRHNAVGVEAKGFAIAIMQRLRDDLSDLAVSQPKGTCLPLMQDVFEFLKPATMKLQFLFSHFIRIGNRSGLSSRLPFQDHRFKQPLLRAPLLQDWLRDRSVQPKGYKQRSLRWLNVRQVTAVKLLILKLVHHSHYLCQLARSGSANWQFALSSMSRLPPSLANCQFALPLRHLTLTDRHLHYPNWRRSP